MCGGTRSRNVTFPAANLGAFVDVFRASDSPCHSPSHRLTTLVVGIESMGVRGGAGGKGTGYPIGAGSAWIPG